MGISLSSAGTFAAASGSVTPTATFSAGQQLIIWTGEAIGSDTITTPSGWTQLDLDTNAPQTRCFGFTSITGSETLPTFNWTGAQVWALATVWNGIDSGFATAGNPSDRAFTVTQNIVCPAVTRTPTSNGALCLYYGQLNKTATTNGKTYTAPDLDGTGGTALLNSYVPAGSNPSVAICYLIQPTAALIASGQLIAGSIAESTAKSGQSGLIILKAAAVAPNALLGWPKQTFVTETVIQV